MTDEDLKSLVERAERAERNCKEMALRMSAMISNRITGHPYDECLKDIRENVIENIEEERKPRVKRNGVLIKDKNNESKPTTL